MKQPTKHPTVRTTSDRALEGDPTIELTRRESIRLLEIMENPPPRNERFLQAQARYRALKQG